jgi:outer membrane receptor for ferrienterochelin and colicin
MNRCRFYFLAFCFLSIFRTSAQDLDSLFSLQAFTAESDLQKVINKDVAVSTLKLSMRETPGIISVITREEIENSGARDLTDVLRMVPGFDVLQDLQFVMGLSLRGSWANEGKILVMLDGIPFNDLLYQSVAVGNRFPVDAVERIEVIRGPGSAVYGGSAEYGVINIITKGSSDLNGAYAYGTAGFHERVIGRTNFGVMAGQKSENFSWDINAFKGQGIVSDQMYDDEYDLAKLSSADPMNIKGGISYRGLSIQGMFDQYNTTEPYSEVSFRSAYADVKYEIKASPRLTVTPAVQYLRQVPWKYTLYEEDGASTGPDFEASATRMLGQINAQLNASRKVSVNFGVIYFQDKSRDLIADEHMLTLNNFAFYSQALFRHRLANATIGFRFEKNNRYAGAFVPRMALTKKIENLHFKVLYSRSFRSPSLQNVLLDTTGARPERSNVFEFEVGYQFTPEMLLSVNAFHITTRDIIIYGSDGEFEWYENYEKSGSKGVELVYSIRKDGWSGSVTYSYNQSVKGNTVDGYALPQTNRQFVGMPAHKVTWNTNVRIPGNLNFNPTLVYAGKRYAYTSVEDDEPVASALEPYVLLNAFLNFKPASLKGLTVGAGVYDILNERPALPQAYNGGTDLYTPVPGRSREYVVKLSYLLNFKR